MRREWLLAILVTLGTLATALFLLRWLAPELIGGPADLRLVQLSESKPAFYDGVFDQVTTREDLPFLVNDPIVVTRGRGLLLQPITEIGPNDLLGFRNRAVPVTADVVVFGDSQTYGNNVAVDLNWPSLAAARLGARAPSGVYSMAIGGWSAPQYAAMVEHALAFRPRVVALALYTGNDALEAFVVTYGNERFAELRPDPALGPDDAPQLEWPAPTAEWWTVRYAPEAQVVFTPKFRRVAIDRSHPAIRSGLTILVQSVRRVAERLGREGVPLIVTVIPTKETAFVPFLQERKAPLPSEFDALVTHERAALAELRFALEAIENVTYVDVVAALQAEVGRNPDAYMRDRDGHPREAGHAAIAAALTPAIQARLPPPPAGPVTIASSDGRPDMLRLVTPDGLWLVEDARLLAENGWDPAAAIPKVGARDLAGFRILGTLREVDPARFGPTVADASL